ncbi:hypothetical protein BDZ89DRAFT_653217 [Hymenopellis radicata]|nr:hypothetical protein BDZ89DRAFT_653217 [Hymenopellis radicata]
MGRYDHRICELDATLRYHVTSGASGATSRVSILHSFFLHDNSQIREKRGAIIPKRFAPRFGSQVRGPELNITFCESVKTQRWLLFAGTPPKASRVVSFIQLYRTLGTVSIVH